MQIKAFCLDTDFPLVVFRWLLAIIGVSRPTLMILTCFDAVEGEKYAYINIKECMNKIRTEVVFCDKKR